MRVVLGVRSGRSALHVAHLAFSGALLTPMLSWQMLRHMNYLPYVGLPNVLTSKFLVPELLQKDATPEKIADAVIMMLNDPENLKAMKQEFTEIHQSLRQNAAKKAAEVVLSYIK